MKHPRISVAAGGGIRQIAMVGAFPPPVVGLALVNAAVKTKLTYAGVSAEIIDTSAPSLDRSLRSRLGRLPRVVTGVLRFACSTRTSTDLYMSVSGGLGQVLELPFLLIARWRGSRVFLHHHSSAYLDRPTRLANLLMKTAGRKAVHIVQSPGLGEQMRLIYDATYAHAVSNAAFFLPGDFDRTSFDRRQLRVLGFLSNISEEKGVLDFLDVMTEIQRRELPVHGKLAGPFVDSHIEQQVRSRLRRLHGVEYVGPKYGEEKAAFYDSIDAFLFPTRNPNETEGLVIHEAMTHRLPVITYGRGAIPEIVTPECGRVISPCDPFSPAAIEQIEAWLAQPRSLLKASRATHRQFMKTHEASAQEWQLLLSVILDGRELNTDTRRVYPDPS